MAGETHSGSGSLTTVIPSKINSDLIAEFREAVIMLPLVDFRPLQKSSLTMSFPRLVTTVALSAISNGSSEANAQSATTVETAVASATAAAKSAHVLASWVSLFGSAVDMESEIPQILGRAAADLMDVDAATLLGGFSNTVGSTGVDATLNDLRAASVLLRRNAKSAARGAVYMLHPQQVDDVDAQLQSGAGQGLSPLLARADMVNWFGAEPGSGVLESYRGSLYGLPVFTSTNVPDANSSADHAGALFVPKLAIKGCYAWLPQIKMASQDVNLKLASSWQVSACYAFVEGKDEAGVSIITDHV